MKQFLIYCQYDYYCQGTESTWGYFLVSSYSFEQACMKIVRDIPGARDFENKTIE